MNHHTTFRIPLLALIIAFVASLSANTPLTPGDLIFTIADSTGMSRAIADATTQTDSLKLSHVGIIDIDPVGNILVIEATGRLGVAVNPIDSFAAHAPAGFIIMRPDSLCDIPRSISRARAFLGRPYDWLYLPDNDSIYCSELVEKSFVDSLGRPIFSTIPMNFRDSKGRMPQFWIDLFQRHGGLPIPEGLPGTNPSQLSRSPRLKRIL